MCDGGPVPHPSDGLDEVVTELDSTSPASTSSLAVSDRPEDLGPQDVVITTVRASCLAAFADQVAPLLGPTTGVVFAQNGVPWWYGMRLPESKPPAPDLAFLVPHGRPAAVIGPERIIGGVIFSSNEVTEPGWIVNDSPERNALSVGEIDDRQSQRIDGLRSALSLAGLHSAAVTTSGRWCGASSSTT